jgi:hypothetical protein
MAWYNTGNIALTNGSATVTGSGTNFLVGAQIGEALYAPDGKLYEIQTIDSATVITLASTYLGSTASAQGYQIIPTQSLVADLASDVTDLISDFANVRDYAGNGKFNDGAVGTPGITFTQDQDNGLYRIGSNNWALAAGGQKIVDISTSGISVTGIVGNLTFPDDSKAIFGAGSDFEIYFNGNHGVIRTASASVSGNIYIQDDNNIVLGSIGGENYLNAAKDGAVTLYYDNAARLATSSSGISVTGSVTATGSAGIGTTDLNGLKTVIKGSTGYPATTGTTQTGVLRLSGGTGLYNVLDMGVNESTDSSWIQATRANSLGTYDSLLLNPNGGNVGIGVAPASTTKFSLTNSVVGANIETTSSTAGHEALILNRQNSFGTSIAFNKAGAAVGVISVVDSDPTGGGGELLIASGNTGLKFDDQVNYIRPANASGGGRDNIVDLGNSTNRFKNLYLSSGVVFGDAGGSGTPSSNTLDSYEEGTWTPVLAAHSGTSPTISGTQYGYYTKVGRLVSVIVELNVTSISGVTSNYITFSLPISAVIGSGYYSQGSQTNNSVAWARPENVGPTLYSASKVGFLSSDNAGGAWNWEAFGAFSGNEIIRISFSYFAA